LKRIEKTKKWDEDCPTGKHMWKREKARVLKNGAAHVNRVQCGGYQKGYPEF